jgi:tRNA(Arg) A34 adenosine deaminase TadA
MSRHESFINRAIGVALTSQYRFRHGAVITKGGRVLSYSPNVKRNDPNIDHENATYHAEEAAIRKFAYSCSYGYLLPQGAMKGYSLYVARVGVDNEPLMSRPCDECMNYIYYLGIRKIGFTNELGGLSHETIM